MRQKPLLRRRLRPARDHAQVVAVQEGREEEGGGIRKADGLHEPDGAVQVEGQHRQEEAPWPKFSRGAPIDARDLSRMLKQFGIGPAQMRHGSGQVGRGYFREHFTKAFARYVKPKPVL